LLAKLEKWKLPQPFAAGLCGGAQNVMYFLVNDMHFAKNLQMVVIHKASDIVALLTV